MNKELLNKITLGDSFEIAEQVEPKTVSLILEDMPYNTTACEWDVEIDLKLYWESRLKMLKPTGVIVLTATQPFATDLINSNRKHFKYDLVWQKSKAGSPLVAKYRPLAKHELVLIFAKGKTTYNPQMTEGKPYKRKWTPNKTNNLKYGIKGVETDNKGTRYPISVLEFQQKWRRQDQMHPTQKPVGLFEYLIRTYTNENELVFDGFGGSGTTAIASYNCNRNFIVVEKERGYYDLATKRLWNEQHKDAG